MRNLNLKANSCFAIIYFPHTNHLVCLTEQISREAFGNDFVSEHPEIVNDQGKFYTLLCGK